MVKLSNISIGSYRPQVKRLNQRDLPILQFNNEFIYPFTSSAKKWLNQERTRVTLEIDNAWMYHNKQRTNPNNNNKTKLSRRVCFWIVIAIILLPIVGAILGIALSLMLLPSRSITSSTILRSNISTTNAATSTLATTTLILIACSNTGHGSAASQNGSTPTTWTTYTYSFSATKTAYTLVFGFQTDGTNSFYLDSVSVVDTAVPLMQLLTNPGFENSTTISTGWIVSCGASAALIGTTSQCLFGNCFQSFLYSWPSCSHLS